MTTYKVISPVADVRQVPDSTALRGKIESQLNMGELFEAEEDLGDWVRGTCLHDGYPGFVEKKCLTREFAAATHIVTAQRSHLYRDDTMKSPVRHTLGMGAHLTVVGESNTFARLDDGSYISLQHIAPLSSREDFVVVAERMLETPYVWAGRSGLGADCSGLVQLALARAGVAAQRDCDQQEDTVGRDVCALPRQRGDLVYFKGHVGIMVDDKNMVHATAAYMKTVIEPLDAVAARAGGITAIRRI